MNLIFLERLCRLKILLKVTVLDEYGRIRAGDVIVGINGNSVSTLEELFYHLEKQAIPFEPILLGLNDHGAIEGIAVFVSTRCQRCILLLDLHVAI